MTQPGSSQSHSHLHHVFNCFSMKTGNGQSLKINIPVQLLSNCIKLINTPCDQSSCVRACIERIIFPAGCRSLVAMLQFDRHYLNGSKFIRVSQVNYSPIARPFMKFSSFFFQGSHSKPPTDFVSRNKRAIRDKSRSQAETRNAVNTTAADQRLKGRPRSSRKALVERQQAERKRETREAGGRRHQQ